MHIESPFVVFLMRISLGWLFFWDGLQKVIDTTWSAGPALQGASFLSDIFLWFADPARVEIISQLNAWGLLLIGAALIIGIRVKLATILGMILMAFYHLLNFDPPFASISGFLIDRHIIYILALALLHTANAGEYWGLDKKLVIKLRD
jgi:thiosulfate dehydrogenase [quinone] large subunit